MATNFCPSDQHCNSEMCLNLKYVEIPNNKFQLMIFCFFLCHGPKGRLCQAIWMNFRKNSKRPLSLYAHPGTLPLIWPQVLFKYTTPQLKYVEGSVHLQNISDKGHC